MKTSSCLIVDRMNRRRVNHLAAALLLLAGMVLGTAHPREAVASIPGAVIYALPAANEDAGASPAVERGRYLVTAMGCHDCHTPWKMGANGPEPDMSRMLSGHPQDVRIEAGVGTSGPWMATVSGTFTAWSGPWGVSFTANLTPDAETGIGKWTEQDFVATVRSGRHLGRGRPLLPPMPSPNVAALNDDDLHAVFAYLRTIPAVKNRVPEPIPPGPGPAPSPGK